MAFDTERDPAPRRAHRRLRSIDRGWAAFAALLLLAACGGGGSEDGTGGGTGGNAGPVGTPIGAAGGTVSGGGSASGARVVIPAGALATTTPIAVEQTAAGSPALPSGFAAVGPTFALTPHGTGFAVPVTVTLPFDPATLPAGSTPELYKTNAAGQWVPVPGASFGASNVTAALGGFSWVRVHGLLRNVPVREWEFGAYPGSGGPEQSLGGATQVGGALEKVVDFGLGLSDIDVIGLTETFPANGKARGYIFGTANGVTYGVYAEAPFAKVGGSDPVGSISRLLQTQNYIKVSPDATLSFTVTAASLSVAESELVRADPADLITGELFLEVEAYTPSRKFFHTAGGAKLTGSRALFTPAVWNYAFSRTPLWSDDQFQFDVFPNSVEPRFGLCRFTRADLELKSNLTVTVDMSSLDVGAEFTLRARTSARAVNRRGGGAPGDCEFSAASAYLRDPIKIGGNDIVFTGLQPTTTPPPLPPADAPVTPAACVPGPRPDPASGTLQFSTPAYAISESAGASPVVTITRTGGSRGAVTATFATSDGTAAAGTDYTATRGSVFFADGDAAPRVVDIPITPDSLVEPDKTVLLTLSEPGGCAGLGAQTTAVLTIQSDDRPPPPPPFGGLDASFGTAGRATMPETGTPPVGFGGSPSAMALQADGKIIMAGGSRADFILARFNADGSLDRSFGIDGKVVTDMRSGNFDPEEALGVAIQADGKIVVVGHATIPTQPPAPKLPPTFALTRYHSDGNLDTSFGTGGRVSNNVNGRAHAVAIQPDGKIVVAGEFSFISNVTGEGSDITVARFNSNGTLDLGFGGSGTGQLASDIGGRVNTARQLVLQPNGSIVVSGTPIGALHTDLMRFNANGLPDASFGGSGKLTILGSDVGQGMALQPDGKLVLVGTVVNPVAPATSRFLLRRLNADGTPDSGFGTAGSVDTALSDNAGAGGVALQADGRIVVVGSRAFSANNNFIVARYATDGTLDTGFGVGGTLSIDFFGFTDVGENVLVQPDGKILVSGSAQSLRSGGYGLARINP